MVVNVEMEKDGETCMDSPEHKCESARDDRIETNHSENNCEYENGFYWSRMETGEERVCKGKSCRVE